MLRAGMASPRSTNGCSGLEETSRERKLKLTDEQIELLERFSPEFRERHIEVHYPGRPRSHGGPVLRSER